MPAPELIAYFATPFVAAWLARRRRLGWLDPVLTCYAVGLLLANSPFAVHEGATKTVAEAVVPLAIPLLLFQTDLRRWLKTSRQTVVGFVVAVFAAVSSVGVMSFLFRGAHEHLWMVAGMFTGTWTGGSPTLVSVGAALEVPEATLILANGADVFVGGIYLFALLTFARPLLARLLPEPVDAEPMGEMGGADSSVRRQVLEGTAVLSLAALIVGSAVGASVMVFGRLSAPWVILGITTAGIALSFVARIREMTTSYTIGNYLILVFCVAIGALTDLGALMASGSVIVGFAASALAMTVILHYTFCALLRIDVDTAIITSVAAVMAPPLVVPVAKRLNNRIAFVSGITSGLVGYAVGNYLGIAMANLVHAWLP